jgi:hypothetical protein
VSHITGHEALLIKTKKIKNERNVFGSSKKIGKKEKYRFQ